MRATVLLAVFFIPATALGQDAAPTKKPPTVGGKPIVQVKPSAPVGCKLVGAVRGTKLWAGDCTASGLRTTSTATDDNDALPLPDRAAGAIPKGPQ
jgi:hypothetical protein